MRGGKGARERETMIIKAHLANVRGGGPPKL